VLRSILALVVLLLALAPSGVDAQGCAPGRVVGESTEGHCCWPGQSWSAPSDRCEGAPVCPEGYGGDGATCVSLEAEVDRPLRPPFPAPAGSLALALSSPFAPALASPPTEPVLTYPRVVNHNVIGGAIALFLTTYGASVAMGFVYASGGCFGPIPFLVPLGSFAAPACGAVAGTIGFALGVGQIISIVLMAAGSSIFRRRGTIPSPSVAWDAGGLSMTF
jgi:hypothetical protein